MECRSGLRYIIAEEKRQENRSLKKNRIMKKLIILTILLAGIFTWSTVNAQVRININIGSQPLWGPAGYSHADYYYLPDAEAYYHVPQRQFIYMDRGRWVTATTLPSRFGRYNLYTM